jgi:predicted phosphodiesterase
VLRAMCEDIAHQRKAGYATADFILATGDLVFSGKADEFKLVDGFFDAVSSASGVRKDRIFCVPGNHDIDRGRQRMCFHGTRKFIESQNQIDQLLSPGDDIETLLKRQENYRNFQNAYFAGQERKWTDDGLGYVSCITVDDVRLAIIALDSAWLAEGGADDHGKLLIGERQVINAVNLVDGLDPHVVIGIAHHPFHLLQDFDRRPVQSRIERLCQFFHCGHLHEPEARTAGFRGSGCLTLGAGASFETRQSRNSYSFVILDLIRGQRTVRTAQYSPASGTFSFASSDEYPIEIAPSGKCKVSELAEVIEVHTESSCPWPHYLSALLLDQKSDLPIPAQNGFTFGSFAVLLAQPDGELRRKTVEFMAFKNVLAVFYNRLQLSEVFGKYGDAVWRYGAALEQTSNANPELKLRLGEQEKDAKAIAGAEPQKMSFSHTVALLAEIAAAGEWDQLRLLAERHVNSSSALVALQARRMLALSLAHSQEAADKTTASALYRSLIQESSEATDTGNLATLLIEAGSFEEAKKVVLSGIEKYPAKAADYFSPIGLRIVDATGDRNFRRRLHQEVAEKEKRD